MKTQKNKTKKVQIIEQKVKARFSWVSFWAILALGNMVLFTMQLFVGTHVSSPYNALTYYLLQGTVLLIASLGMGFASGKEYTSESIKEVTIKEI